LRAAEGFLTSPLNIKSIPGALFMTILNRLSLYNILKNVLFFMFFKIYSNIYLRIGLIDISWVKREAQREKAIIL
jgi:hypothetical protein